MSVAEAIAILRASNWCPGRSTADHPQRAAIKAAFQVLRDHKVDVHSLGLVHVPPPVEDPDAPFLVPGELEGAVVVFEDGSEGRTYPPVTFSVAEPPKVKGKRK